MVFEYLILFGVHVLILSRLFLLNFSFNGEDIVCQTSKTPFYHIHNASNFVKNSQICVIHTLLHIWKCDLTRSIIPEELTL